MKKKQLLMALVIALVVVGSVGVSAASAQTTNTTNTTNNTRPGNGFGDDNHHHTGPPGQSVRPGDGDNDNDGQGNDHDNNISSQNFRNFFAQLQQAFHSFFIHFG